MVRRIAILLVIALVVATTTEAQRGRGRGGRFGGAFLRYATPDTFDGDFHFCRIMFRNNPNGDGGGWGVDYPRADVNLSIRFSELTFARVSFDPSGEPKHVVMDLSDDALFQCPFIMMTEVGALYLDPHEAERLRDYLLKGGFLWADDFWGTYAWSVWEGEFAKVLPAGQYPMRDLPLDHPLFKTMFVVPKVVQIPSINFWAGSGGGTSERYGDSAVAHARGVFDQRNRLLVLITHNTDFGDSWEREGDDPEYFLRFSVDGYAFAVNVLLYAMTH
jgi:Domain of unknown function (DUF4159)